MPLHTIDTGHIMKDVYSYPFPEVRETLNACNLPQEFMFNTLSIEEAAGYLSTYGFQPVLDLPARATDGTLDLDELHVPVIDRIRAQVGASLPGLDTFANAYPIPGSNQAIFNLLAEWNATGNLESLAVLEGEYEGYAANAEALRIPVTKYRTLDEAEPRPGEVWFVSNPSARDGNWVERNQWDTFVNAGHQIVYDTAYVGLTPDGEIDVSSPNIQAVVTSPSKIFGVFRNRYTGVTYTREPVASLYSSKWFKSIPGLLNTLRLYESFGENELPVKYRPVQEEICRGLGIAVQAEVLPSDTLLLAHTMEEVGEEYKHFARAGVYRFGLAKLFEDYEKMRHQT